MLKHEIDFNVFRMSKVCEVLKVKLDYGNDSFVGENQVLLADVLHFAVCVGIVPCFSYLLLVGAFWSTWYCLFSLRVEPEALGCY